MLPFPRPAVQFNPSALAPSGRSLLVAAGLFIAGVGAYVGARETSVFAVRTIDVHGAPPGVAVRVRAALRPVLGKSLVSLDGADVRRRVTALPQVVSATYDRAFPSTLRVVVETERPVAVLRQGAHAWLVSARGRALRTLPPHGRPVLPRVWLPPTSDVSVGATISDNKGALAVRALAPIAGTRFSRRVVKARQDGEDVTLVLHSGVEVFLGAPRDIPVKVAVARRILPGVKRARYVDVSVPRWPVSGNTNPQVEGRALGLTLSVTGASR